MLRHSVLILVILLGVTAAWVWYREACHKIVPADSLSGPSVTPDEYEHVPIRPKIVVEDPDGPHISILSCDPPGIHATIRWSGRIVWDAPLPGWYDTFVSINSSSGPQCLSVWVGDRDEEVRIEVKSGDKSRFYLIDPEGQYGPGLIKDSTDWEFQ